MTVLSINTYHLQPALYLAQAVGVYVLDFMSYLCDCSVNGAATTLLYSLMETKCCKITAGENSSTVHTFLPFFFLFNSLFYFSCFLSQRNTP